MTLVFSANKPATARGETHALVIGVADYPHLLDGSAFANMPAAALMGLGQLTSPVQSAQAFASWLRNRYANYTAPLGSIEVLLSPSPPGVATATMANVKVSFDDWVARCDQSVDNVAFLYFCGHGIQAELLALLVEDFGKAPNRLWENAIDFDGTLDGMAECAAQTQCYFVDSCRETPIEALRQLGRLGATALKSTSASQLPLREAAVYLATPVGQQAHAPVKGVSYFTQALIDCLAQFGARGHDGVNWVVSTDSLKIALKARMRRTLVNGSRLACDTGGGVGNLGAIDLHNWIGPAHVLAEVVSQPADALEYTDLCLQSTAGLMMTRGPHPDPWELELDADRSVGYDLKVVLQPGAPYSTVPPVQVPFLYPPFHIFKLRAGP